MSITKNGIKLKKAKNRRRIFLSLLAFVEILLTVFLYISFAAHTIWPEKAQGTAGVAKVLSYEGRLTDTNGNPVGGIGTNYCFRFSVYNASTAGTKLWPTGTAATTTLMVKDGIFDALIGSADTLDYNFYNSDTVYLDVAVNTASTTCATGGGGTWESLSPRQRIAATGYAITAANVYSDLLRTDIASSTVQIGTGAGSPTIKLLLDTKNSTDSVGAACSPSGTMWYNSADGKNRILVCENQIITPISNATTTIAAIGVNAGAPVSAGTVVFSNSNNVTFGINGSTITASITAAGGGGGVTLSQWEPYLLATSTATLSLAPASIWFNTINLPQAVAISKVNLVKSFNMGLCAGTSTGSSCRESFSYSQGFSIFTRQDYAANSTNLSYLTSGSVGISYSFSQTSSSQSLSVAWVTNSTGGTSSWSSSSAGATAGLVSSWTGLKYLPVPLVTTLTAGEYWIGHRQSSTGSTVNSAITIASISHLWVSYPAMSMGQIGFAGNRSWHPGKQGHGYASAFTTNNTMAMTVISTNSQQFPYFNFVNF